MQNDFDRSLEQLDPIPYKGASNNFAATDRNEIEPNNHRAVNSEAMISGANPVPLTSERGHRPNQSNNTNLPQQQTNPG